MKYLITIESPGSKSVSHRALLCGSLAKPGSIIKNILMCDDTKATLSAIKQMGGDYLINDSDITIVKSLCSHKEQIKINCQESGTTFRFAVVLAAVLGLDAELDGIGRLRERPINSLVNSLKTIGADITDTNGFAPIKISPCKVSGNSIDIDVSKSSQFVSAMLIAAPLLENGLKIVPYGEMKSRPYIDITCKVLEQFGINVDLQSDYLYVKKGQQYNSCTFKVEGDYSSAAFLLAASLISNKTIKIENLKPDSVQGDKKVIDYFRAMGANIYWNNSSLICEPAMEIRPLEADLTETPDLAPILAVACSFAEGKSVLTGIEHLQYKESDRVKTIVDNLKRCSIIVESDKNRIEIIGGEHKSADIITDHDHRISMAFQVAALNGTDIKVDDHNCVKKSYPEFKKDMEKFK